jgi:hypothetical protein
MCLILELLCHLTFHVSNNDQERLGEATEVTSPNHAKWQEKTIQKGGISILQQVTFSVRPTGGNLHSSWLLGQSGHFLDADIGRIYNVVLT